MDTAREALNSLNPSLTFFAIMREPHENWHSADYHMIQTIIFRKRVGVYDAVCLIFDQIFVLYYIMNRI